MPRERRHAARRCDEPPLRRARDVLRALRSDDGDYDDESGGGGGGGDDSDDDTRGREVVLVDSEI